MTSFSVKKPFTVFVAVVAVLVFGVMSYVKMTPDLMPNMDYPYVVVVTTYPGAAPEEVEAVVTKPMEQSMATLNDIKTVTSTSAENYSMLVLEFEQDTNMDSAVVDILQKTQLLAGGWDDTVGTPSIVRINPNMIPVMVAAVDSSEMDRYELSRFAGDTVIPALEGTTGVASVTAGGMIERTMTIEINEKKLDKMNEKIADAINAAMEDARQQLEDAQKELDENRGAVEAGTNQLLGASSGITESIKQGEADLADTVTAAGESAVKLAAARAAIDLLKTQLTEAENALAAAEAQLAETDARIVSLEADSALYAKALGEPYDSMDASTSLEDAGLDADTVAALNAKGCTDLGSVRTRNELNDVNLSAQRTARAAQAVAVETARVQVEELRTQIAEAEEEYARLEEDSKQQMESLEALQKQLEELPAELMGGVTQISLAGGQLAAAQTALTSAQAQLDAAVKTLEEQLASALDAADLHSVLTLETVSSLVAAQNLDMPAGYVYDEKGNGVIVTVGDAIADGEELENLVLFDLGIEGLDPIRVCDVADVVRADNGSEIYASLNGNSGLILMFSKQSNYATAKVSDNIRAVFDELSAQYPGLTFTALMDQGDYIYLLRDSILSSLLWGALFSVVILFLFLRDWRPTVITLCSIPISLLFAFTLMYFTGVSVNIMSLSGLSISVGMLVDNSVVVIENTYRLRALGESTVKSAVSGARQVGGAIAASTLTTICVFIPIAFVEGLTRELFTDMVLTLAYSLIASLIVAVTLVPALAGRLLAHAKPQRETAFTRFMPKYKKSVLWAVRHKAVTLLTAVALLAASGAAVLTRGFTFLPDMEMEQMMVTLTMPEGSSFAETTAAADEAAARMLAVPGVETVGGTVGDSAGSGLSLSASDGDVSFYVLLEKGYKASRVAGEINEKCADMDAEVNADANSLMSSMMQMLSGSGITVRVYSNDLDDLRVTADAVADVLRGVEGTENVAAGEEAPTAELHFTVDKEKAAKEQLTVAQVYMQVAKALAGSADLLELTDGGDTYAVSVQTAGKDKITPEYVRSLTFDVTAKDGTVHSVALRDIATVEETESLSSIRRLNQRRYIDVTADIAEGYNVTLVTDAAEEALASFTPADGTSVGFTGERESIVEALKQLIIMLAVGVLLVYLVMVAQFQDLKSPFIVMFTIPLAFTGGFLALLIAGLEISLLSMLGMIMLVGIIVNNGIVLVDYINQLRIGGMDRREAIAEAAVTRLRPILMTSITTILGLIVMALGQSEATSLIQPLAVTCIGGLLYATLMTLFVVPVMYDALSKKELYRVDEADLALSEK